jgi:hypothetical protein
MRIGTFKLAHDRFHESESSQTFCFVTPIERAG